MLSFITQLTNENPITVQLLDLQNERNLSYLNTWCNYIMVLDKRITPGEKTVSIITNCFSTVALLETNLVTP